MKALKSLTLVAAVGLCLSACHTTGKPAANSDVTPQEVDSVSLAIGHSLGSMVKQSNFGDLNVSLMVKGFKEIMGREESITQEEMMAWNQAINNFMNNKRQREGERNLEAGRKFLEENATKEGVVTSPTGLQYKILATGEPPMPTATDTVEVNYRGTLLDGTEFDSSYERGTPAKFPLNRVIPAWTEGMQLVGAGGKIILYAPADLAYRDQGAGDMIGPNSTLIFEIEVLNVFPAATVAVEKKK